MTLLIALSILIFAVAWVAVELYELRQTIRHATYQHAALVAELRELVEEDDLATWQPWPNVHTGEWSDN